VKAVIPAAGLGTRILPATKAIPKELLALVDRPMIQYVVEEAAAAGISDVVIVTSPGKEALAAHFAPALELERALEAKGKDDLLEAVRRVDELANITFATQSEPLGLGHAVGCAREVVGSDPFAVLLPDELFGGPGLLNALIRCYERFAAPVIAVMEMPVEEISNYGVVDPEPPGARGVPDELGKDLVRMKGFVEKPPASEAPSNLGSIGRYVLTPDVFEALERTAPGAGGEIQLTDAVATVAGEKDGYAFIHRGLRHDVGRPFGFLRATVELALDHPDVGDEFRAYLVDYVKGLDAS
jgi:UTP--glucose-1-phosphate uridylyltransferase